MAVKRNWRCISLGALVATSLIVASAHAEASVTVVMSGLDNPRGIAFGPEGGLYVAEAGRGGAGPCQVSNVGEKRCYGKTGAISRLWRGKQERIISDLPSHALPDGTAASGPDDIGFVGRGSAFITIGLGGSPAYRAAFNDPMLGTLQQMSASGELRQVADLAAHELANNPDHGAIDSNPYGLLAEPNARIVADAGANALIRVAANGDTSTVAVFPSRSTGASTDAVPTSVVLGPDGAYYVGQLTGVPFTAGAANVFRVIPGAAPAVFAAGFKTIMDLAFGPDGSLYVLEHASSPVFFNPNGGRVVRVAPNGQRSTVIAALHRPTSLAFGPDGALYVTDNGIYPQIGQVLRVELP